ncbi:MAG: hypothetical protein GX131_17330 [candidate division WS1 bacterium]|jgi:hypothetical protein|nr:hypothetical protein [candidate division WS1 bacterium]
MTERQPTDCTEHCLAYLDILGFKKFVNEAVEEDATAQKILALRVAVDRAKEQARKMRKAGQGRWDDLQMQILSDAIFIALPSTSSFCKRTMQMLVGYIQLSLAVPNPGEDLTWPMALQLPPCHSAEDLHLFVRGAIVEGPHYAAEDILFSPAWIEGYMNETKHAVFPRVVLCPGKLDAFDSYEDARNRLFWQNMVWRDFDGLPFINYLNILTEYPSEALEWTLREHQHVIIRKIRQYGTDLRVAPKYWWLASYHNAFCRFADIDPDTASNLAIPNVALPGHEQLGAWAAKEQSQ